jgi:hypothetical protein
MDMACVTVSVAQPTQPTQPTPPPQLTPPQLTPQVSLTGIRFVDKTTNATVTSVNTTDPLSKYALSITYSSTGTGKCIVTISVNGQTASIGTATISSGNGGWIFDLDQIGGGKLAGKTIADLMSYFKVTGSQIQFCADISSVTA